MLKRMQLGIFGGSFDPVHRGHLLLADCCWRQARLDRVLLIPAAHQPHKSRAPEAGDADRMAMLRLAIAGRPEFEASSLELDRGGASYTVETLRALRQSVPDAELFFLLGADALADLPRWREPQQICELATPVAVRRAGSGEPDYDALAGIVSAARLGEIRAAQVDMPATAVSSSEVRRRIAAGDPWETLTAPAVAEYIIAHRLYGYRPRRRD